MIMTPRSRSAVFTGVLVILLGLTAAASTEERVKHSGSIVSIADDGGTFVLAEVGPWRVRNGATVITRRTITLAPETELAIVARDETPPSGFSGDFVETRLGPDGIYLNDYVTVDCRHEGQRMIALRITVSEPWVDAAASGTLP
jgi:hypothetical protein